MKIIFSDLTDLNTSLPEGIMDKQGLPIVEKIDAKLEKQFNNYAQGVRISAAGWYEQDSDHACMSHLRDTNTKKYDLDKINPNWLATLDMYLDRLSQYNIGGTPFCIISFFMKYTYQPVWFNNNQGINGWWDKKAWPYVEKYLETLISLAESYQDNNKLDILLEICNEPTAKMKPMITKIFHYLLEIYDYQEFTTGHQKLKKGAGTSFTKPGAYKNFKSQFSDNIMRAIDEECPGVVHQFFKIECPKRMMSEDNLHAADKTYYWSTDGDKNLAGGIKPNKRPSQMYFDKLIPLFKDKEIWDCYFKNSFFEPFTYNNTDACLYLAIAYKAAFGRYPNKLTNKVAESEENDVPEPENEPTKPIITYDPEIDKQKEDFIMMKNWRDFNGFWRWIKSQGWFVFLVHAIVLFLLGGLIL